MKANLAKEATLEKPSVATERFLTDLAEISHRHGLGVAGDPVLFVLEPDDAALRYECDEESRLILA